MSLVSDPLDPIITQEWQTFDGTNLEFLQNQKPTDSETLITLIDNKIRLKVESQFGEIAYSNILTYTKESVSDIYISNIVTSNGLTNYKLHVENEAFVGYANMSGDRINVKKYYCFRYLWKCFNSS